MISKGSAGFATRAQLGLGWVRLHDAVRRSINLAPEETRERIPDLLAPAVQRRSLARGGVSAVARPG
jgi:hypothetical protein